MIRTDELLPHMRRVQAVERDLRDLFVVWQMIESSAAISCPEAVAPILPALLRTRERFDSLRSRVIELMVREGEGALADAMAARAQCAIDILVRNLFERTADVGFLATDATLVDYCAGSEHGGVARAAIGERLREYRDKYTVYDDVILLAPDGRVLARLQEGTGPEQSTDSIVLEALDSDSYVERFRKSDLAADDHGALLYAHRISSAGRRVGVLVLRFRFSDEMARIFAGIRAGDHRLALVIVDAADRVIATADGAHIPLGAELAPVASDGLELAPFAGREYLSVCRASPGYQGYPGPAWRARAMLSLENAFREEANSGDQSDAPLDSNTLDQMVSDAEVIGRELRLVMWNGRLMAGAQDTDRSRLKAVLQQVNDAGLRTRERLRSGLGTIRSTVLARARRHCQELARLAGDILDRNLYERANDCRWWALSPALRLGLMEPATAENAGRLGSVLDYVNGLYTVYTRLVVFDAEGQIRGISRASNAPNVVGSGVPAEWLERVRPLNDSQRYAVTSWGDTHLHDTGPTYVYLAAIREPGRGSRLLGGIGIVFNSATEFHGMLRDVMQGTEGAAAFVDAAGNVLAATDPVLAEQIARGCIGTSATVEHAGAHYACARVPATGYREFKITDGYANHVDVVVGVKLGSGRCRSTLERDVDLRANPIPPGTPAMEIAAFEVAGQRCALPVAAVLDAKPAQGIVQGPRTRGCFVGMVETRSEHGVSVVPVICGRRLLGLPDAPARDDAVLIVMRVTEPSGRPLIAIRVDDVAAVLDVAHAYVRATPHDIEVCAPWVAALMDCRLALAGGADAEIEEMVQLLDPEKLLAAARGEPMAA